MAKTWGKLGGNGKMHGKTGTATQKPGVSSQEGHGALSGGAGDPQAGPPGAARVSSGASNQDYAGTQKPGVTAATKSGGDAKFAQGGSSNMFGNRGSLPAQGGRTAP